MHDYHENNDLRTEKDVNAVKGIQGAFVYRCRNGCVVFALALNDLSTANIMEAPFENGTYYDLFRCGYGFFTYFYLRFSIFAWIFVIKAETIY